MQLCGAFNQHTSFDRELNVHIQQTTISMAALVEPVNVPVCELVEVDAAEFVKRCFE
jgi:hypothetical protein